MKLKFIFDGKIISYLDVNGEQDKAIVFIHGNSLSSEYFERFFHTSLLQDFRLIAIDLPGHGESESMDSYEMKDFIGPLTGLISHLGLKDYILLGHSFGGHVIAQSLPFLSPSAIFLCATPPLTNPITGGFLPDEMMGLYYQADVSDEDLDKLFGNQISTYDYLKRDFRQTDPGFRTSLANIVSRGSFSDETRHLMAFEQRSMLIASESDPFIDINYVSDMAHRLGTEFLLIPGSHHFLLENVEKISEMIAGSFGAREFIFQATTSELHS